MSDTTAAPTAAPQSAPEAPQPVQHEVPINEAPPGSPTPVGSQAPDKPSRREAIQAAFDRANNPQKAKAEPAKAAPAEAGKGHNQPPEDTPQEKFDLRRPRSDQPRERGERGRFVSREDERRGEVQRGRFDGQAGVPGHAQEGKLPPHAPYAEPPPRMADHAKAEWHATPEKVRGEIYRMHSEFQGAYEQYREAAEAFEPVRGYHQMALEHGTTLDRALSNYVTMEQKLRRDLVGGLDTIVNNLNLNTADGRRITLADVAWHILNQSPEQHKLVQQQNAQQAAAQQIGSLHQEIDGLKSHLHQMYAEQQFGQIRSGIDQYADDGRHPRFDELADLIKNEVELGFDLESAYQRAELLRPATHAAQTRNPSAQTRPTDKSIYGAPEAGPSNGTQRRSAKPVGRREAIQNAIRRANGAL